VRSSHRRRIAGDSGFSQSLLLRLCADALQHLMLRCRARSSSCVSDAIGFFDTRPRYRRSPDFQALVVVVSKKIPQAFYLALSLAFAAQQCVPA